MNADPSGDRRARQRLDAVVRGRVQGVGFRMFASRSATAHGLVGWVANESEGTVHCVAEGPRAALEAFARDLAMGPPGSVVDRIDSSWSAATGGFDRFALRSGWHGGD
ncbi:MAG: acylphosphatase [Chloroflexota bacterium]|jgi:acylphosphatase|nr:acylphosphatase [Chloroflexota bacterium]